MEGVLQVIKGLYFKLNMDNPNDKEIHDFFIDETKRYGINKIKLLHIMIRAFKVHRILEDEND